ncbi:MULTISPECIES: Gfo/Idh/MocA family protein [Paenibacillus]|uniref:Gfo/Idh/MocA family protein n=1 Tax=Paenibacillus TaxID=44249 RepID=UPI001FC94BB0|nr:Gfo/Idh/MocA family oxidoreductase [Paenibacillus rhizosphaerae]
MKQQHQKIRIVVVGLRFGGAFAPIYHAHPDVEHVAICDSDEQLLHQYGDKFGFDRRYVSLEDVLTSDEYDAVHLVSPIHMHAKQTIQVLDSGKHCACTVPMATTLEELKAIVEAQKRNDKNYMMMETAVYTYQFLFAKRNASSWRLWPYSILARSSLSGYGELADLLDGSSSYALCNPCDCPTA